MRTYQETVNDSVEHAGPELLDEPSKPIREEEAKRDFLDITALIRSLQRVEGNPECFRKDKDDCDEVDCAWRSYCLGTHQTASEKKES